MRPPGPGIRHALRAALAAAVLTGLAGPALAQPASPTRLITLGTAGGPVPHVERAQPANVLIVNGRPYLIDTGNGVLRQLVAAKVSPMKIDVIFVTHHHDDHNADLGTFMGSAWDRGRTTPIDVYGPNGTVETLAGFYKFFQRNADLRSSDVPRPAPAAVFIGHDVPAPGIIYRDDNVTVTAVENTHFAGLRPGTPAYGRDKSYAYRFDAKDRAVVFTGDTGPSERVTDLARGADLLVAEVVDPASMAVMLRRIYATETDEQRGAHLRHFIEDHLTPEAIGKMAAAAGVKEVVLTHLVPGEDGERDTSGYSDGVKKYFDGPVTVAHDLQVF